MKTSVHFMTTPQFFLLRIADVSIEICTKNLNIHFMFSNFFLNNCAICEIMWKNSAESSKPQTTIWHMHIACWIPQATNILSEYVMLIVFHCNNGCMNTPQYYIICALPVLLAGYSHVLHEDNHMEIYMNPVFLCTITIPNVTCITVMYNLVQQPQQRNWSIGILASLDATHLKLPTASYPSTIQCKPITHWFLLLCIS